MSEPFKYTWGELLEQRLKRLEEQEERIDKLERKILILDQEIAALQEIAAIIGRGAIIRQKLREIDKGSVDE